MTVARLIGLLLLILVGYHYINEPVGFSLPGSVATIVFAICLIAVYRGYAPSGRNWVGWGLITLGCLLLGALQTLFSWVVILPLLVIVIGFRVAELDLDFWETVFQGNGRGGDAGGGYWTGGDGGGDGGGGGD